MPVLDHDTHPSTISVLGDKYGCWNRAAFSTGYYAEDREYQSTGEFVHSVNNIVHTMSTTCRNYLLWDTDPKCSGCTAPKDFNYKTIMGEL